MTRLVFFYGRVLVMLFFAPGARLPKNKNKLEIFHGKVQIMKKMPI